MMHVGGHLRDPLIEAFDEEELDWQKQLGSKEDALKLLRKLYVSTDQVPGYTRDRAVEWLEFEGEDDAADRLRAGCSFGALARALVRRLVDAE